MKLFQIFIFIFLVGIIFQKWFMPGLISAGDFWFYYPSMYGEFDRAFYAWNFEKGNGLGMNSVLFQAVLTTFGLPIYLLGILLKIPWETIERIGFFYPFLIICTFSSYFYHKEVLRTTKLWVLSAIVFLFNTYILTLVSGGQILIGIAYAFSPILLVQFINLEKLEKLNSRKSFLTMLLAGLLLGIEMTIDLRIAYVMGIAITVYFVFRTLLLGLNFGIFLRKFFFLLLSTIIAVLLNLYWGIQLLIKRGNPLQELGDAYSTVGSLKFFSFASLENSISLLHPNWPENLFGKIYFMRPEFLFIPIIAFASFLFLKKTKINRKLKEMVIFSGLLGMIGAFLAKGTQEPFGEVYVFLFENVPGMVMFRDPTKFYLLVILSFTILIPFCLYQLTDLFKKVKYINFYVLTSFIIFWCITIWPGIMGQLGGVFTYTNLPEAYKKFEVFLRGDKDFYRTLWIPQVQRFGFFSPTHPAIVAEDFFQIHTYADLVSHISQEETLENLRAMSVKYIVVPYDSEGEIFLDDRKYKDSLRRELIAGLRGIDSLKELKTFQPIAVFELSGYRGHAWSSVDKSIINSKKISPVEFEIDMKNIAKGSKLIFSESYDPKWIARKGKEEILAEKNGNMNSFTLPEKGDYTLILYYTMQNYVKIGVVISAITFLSVVSAILYLQFLRK